MEKSKIKLKIENDINLEDFANFLQEEERSAVDKPKSKFVKNDFEVITLGRELLAYLNPILIRDENFIFLKFEFFR